MRFANRHRLNCATVLFPSCREGRPDREGDRQAARWRLTPRFGGEGCRPPGSQSRPRCDRGTERPTVSIWRVPASAVPGRGWRAIALGLGLAVWLVASGCGVAQADGRQVPVVVESAAAVPAADGTGGLELTVEGYHPDGCAAPVTVDRQQQGDRLTVQLYRTLPEDVGCPAVVVPYRETLRLDGPFSPGIARLSVNGYEVEIAEPGDR